MTKNSERQRLQVQALEIAPDDHYEVVKFTAEEIGDSVYITRAYVPLHARNVRYFECWSVGPRGGAKLRSKTFSY